MKKAVSLFLSIMIMISLLSACRAADPAARGSGTGSSGDPAGTMHIVATIFPEYDWVINILGDNPAGIEVTLLAGSGVDMHSFQPTAADILKIVTCDLFIYVGGESDRWVEDALKEGTNPNRRVIRLLEALGDRVREEELVEGMEEDPDDENHDNENHDHDHDEEELDEHVWLSLINARMLVENISQTLQQMDPDHAPVYEGNARAYLEKLDALDGDYRAAVAEAACTTILFGDRFPFRYLADDYGLAYFAAFPGCSAETEASFETIAFLSQKTEELSLPVVLTIEGTDHRLAETIVQNTRTQDQQVLALDSMQSVTMKEVAAGVTYLSIMEKNLQVLKAAMQP